MNDTACYPAGYTDHPKKLSRKKGQLFFFRIFLFVGLILLHAAFLQTASVFASSSSISDSVLRLRVVANSNQEADQQLKLDFKSRLCESLRPFLGACKTREEASSWILANRDRITRESQKILEDLTGSSDSCSCQVALKKDYFPIRTYGRLTFPPGYYQSLVITLGEGAGKNWWCVLYPSLCFTDETCATFPGESREKLEETLSEEDYQTLCQGVTFRLRLAELIGNLFCKDRP